MDKGEKRRPLLCDDDLQDGAQEKQAPPPEDRQQSSGGPRDEVMINTRLSDDVRRAGSASWKDC